MLIVGAGLSGLTAASRLRRAGKSVTLVDKGRSVGGRLATRRIGNATLDHGAQFFTVRSPEFAAVVDEWVAAGAVGVWANGFEDPPDGYPRYRGEGGMSHLAKHMAARVTQDGAEIVLSQRAAAIIPGPDGLTLTYDGGSREPDEAASVIVTSPVPQTIDILNNGGVRYPDALDLVEYFKVVGFLLTLDKNPTLGPVGARQRPLDPIFTWIADNQVKGVSAQPALTLHMEHALSEALYDLPAEEIVQRLQTEIDAVVGDAKIQDLQVKKWRYAGPIKPHPDRAVSIQTMGGTVVLCGDAFGGPKVEGAFLSGIAAADALLGNP